MDKDQKNFHKSRRINFSKTLGKDAMAVIFGSTHKNKSYDGDFEFEQHKNFYYLTGFNEPNAALVIAPAGIKINDEGVEKTYTEILYVQKKDPLMETWNGLRLDHREVKSELGIEKAFENEKIKNILNPVIFRKFSKLFLNFGEMIKLTEEMKVHTTMFMNGLNRYAANIEVTDASYLLGKMRAVKTPFEINLIKRAADISINSYNETLKVISANVNESQVQATLEYHYKYNGGESAYGAIVASGENACILHYEKNNLDLKNGDLLLIDSAAEFQNYCSDITRTFPVNGKFSEDQKKIYEIVLKANKECIKRIRPGVKWSAIGELSNKILADGLYGLGLLKNKKDIRKYSLHGVGHHIGLDTHDAVPGAKTFSTDNDTLKEGNVLTVEPGLYFPLTMKEVPQKFRGMGVRIEDVILVTKSGNLNLTEKMSKETNEIEALMSGSIS
ncbi:MAG: aminopeptidase P family protein [Ignavibacteria bacterium]